MARHLKIISSSIALWTLLQEWIGDTIRVSITPQKWESRTKEIAVCQDILQSLGMRNFSPKVVSCPWCGRTTWNDFSNMAERISKKVALKKIKWAQQYPHFSSLHIAVMWCVVNGLWEAKSADIGIFFPGKWEGKKAILCVKWEQKILQSEKLWDIENIFFNEIEKVLKNWKIH